MPEVKMNGKVVKYPYTKKGIADAKAAKMAALKNVKGKKY